MMIFFLKCWADCFLIKPGVFTSCSFFKMSYFKKILFLCVIASIFCGCGQKEFGVKHSHFGIGASVNLPENWQRIELSPAANISSMAFADEKESLIIVTKNYGTTFREQLKLTSEINFPVLEQGVLLFAKYKTKWFVSVEGKTSYITYVIKAPGAYPFSITCAAPSINFVSYRPVCDRIAKSFRAL